MNVKFKKILSFGVVLASVGLILTACSGKKSGQSANKDTKHGIALITDENGVDDHSFNQAAWSGFKAYGKEHGLKQGKGGSRNGSFEGCGGTRRGVAGSRVGGSERRPDKKHPGIRGEAGTDSGGCQGDELYSEFFRADALRVFFAYARGSDRQRGCVCPFPAAGRDRAGGGPARISASDCRDA